MSQTRFILGERTKPWSIKRIQGDIICQLTTAEMPRKDGRVLRDESQLSQKVKYYVGKDEFGNKFDYDPLNKSSKEDYDIMKESNMIRLFGVTEDGATVSITLKSYPTFYIRIEKEWTKKQIRYFVNMAKDLVRDQIKERTLSYAKGAFGEALADFNSNACESLIVNNDGTIKDIYMKEYFGYDFEEERRFLEFKFHSYEGMQMFSKVFNDPYAKSKNKKQPKRYNPLLKRKVKWELYQFNNDLPLLKFYHNNNITPNGWIKVKDGMYEIVKNSPCVGNINIFIDVDKYSTAITHVEKDTFAPLLSASFDIECFGNGKFPKADRVDNECFMIATTVNRVGSKDILYTHCVTLGSYKIQEDENLEHFVKNAEIIQCETEDELLLEWAKFIRKLNPDIVTGYNIFGFDMPYLFTRASEIHGIREEYCNLLSRVNGWQSNLEKKELRSSALGQNFLYMQYMPGIVLMDAYQVIKGDFTMKLASYKLDNVASRYLGDNKEDVPPHLIGKYYKSGPEERGLLIKYCIKDCVLVNHLSAVLCLIVNNISQANVCLVPLRFIFVRGQGIKIYSKVIKFCNTNGYILKTRLRDEEYGPKYEGSIVFDAIPGFYTGKVTVLDYASLYPRTAWNDHISCETWVSPEIYERVMKLVKTGNIRVRSQTYVDAEVICKIFKKEATRQFSVKLKCPKKVDRQKCRPEFFCEGTGKTHHVTIPDDILEGQVFYAIVKEQVFVQPEDGSISSKLFSNLNESRSAAKNKMKAAKKVGNKMAAMVGNSEQLAFKLVMNSTYGQWGAPTSPIYFKQVAASITRGGRKAIWFTKKIIESLDIVKTPDGDSVDIHDPNNNNVTHPLAFKVIYGDTDSVFYVIKHKTCVLYNMKIGDRISEIVIREMYKNRPGDPIIHDLEFEKVIYPLVLINKKRYSGRYYTDPNNPEKYYDNSMGDASKRRDFAPIVKTVYNKMKKILFDEMNFNKATYTVISMVDNLLNCEYNHDMTQMITSRSLKDPSSYKNPKMVPHLVLAMRHKKRNPGFQIQSGARIQYGFHEKFDTKNPGAGENIEIPDYIVKNKLHLDVMHYAKHIIDATSPIIEMEIPYGKHLFDDMIKKQKIRKNFIIKQYLAKAMHEKNKQRTLIPFKDPYSCKKSKYIKCNYPENTNWHILAMQNYKKSNKFKSAIKKGDKNIPLFKL